MTISIMRVACGVPQGTHTNTHTHTHTLIIRNAYCFSTTIMVVRTRANITLYVHWLYCLFALKADQELQQLDITQ